MLPIDGDTLKAIAPTFTGVKADRQRGIIEAVSGVLRGTLADYDINTPLRIAHFLAQIAHESAGFRTTEEFASGAAYEGRLDLGNTEKGDGKRFKGRGLIQLTGRANYKTFGDRMGIDLIANPETAAEPALSLRIACEYWADREINGPADRDDLITVTRRINGGLNGLEDRRNRLRKAKIEMARLGAGEVAVDADPSAGPVLRRGSRGASVASLQEALSAKGFSLAIDGDFGPATELAVKQFQQRKRLEVDGIVGPATWGELKR
ncbi:MAG: peptidoglycan-binding protein [Pseudomonadota bacterium]